jgi:hypothetical protein
MCLVFAYEIHHLLNCSNDVLCSFLFIFQYLCFLKKIPFFFSFFLFFQVVLLYDLHYNSFVFKNCFHHILDFYYGLMVHGCYYQIDV